MDEDTNEPRPLFFEVTADFRAESARLIERVQFEIAFSFFLSFSFSPRQICSAYNNNNNGEQNFPRYFRYGRKRGDGREKKGRNILDIGQI